MSVIEDRKNDAALRLSKLIWAVQRGELTKDEAVAQAEADDGIVRFFFSGEAG